MVLRIYEESFDPETAPSPPKRRRTQSPPPALAPPSPAVDEWTRKLIDLYDETFTAALAQRSSKRKSIDDGPSTSTASSAIWTQNLIRLYDETFVAALAEPPSKRESTDDGPSTSTASADIDEGESDGSIYMVDKATQTDRAKWCLYCKPSEATILDLPGDDLASIFKYLSKSDRAKLSLTCKTFENVVFFEFGNNRFSTIDIDWRSQVQRVAGVSARNSFDFMTDPFFSTMKRSSYEMRVFKDGRADTLTVKFNDQLDSLLTPSCGTPNSSTSSDVISSLFKTVKFQKLEAHFNSTQEYSSIFCSTFLVGRSLKKSEVYLIWSGDCSQDVQQARTLLWKIPLLNKLKIEWMLVNGKLPDRTTGTCLLDDTLLLHLTQCSKEASIIAHGDFTAKGIMAAFEEVSRSTSGYKKLTIYASMAVIDELFANEKEHALSDADGIFRVLMFKAARTRLAVKHSQICIENPVNLTRFDK